MIMGVRQSQGLFLEPISQFMKDGKEFFSFAIGFQAIIWGVVTFGLGILIDRFGPQKVLAFGIICFASGVFLMSIPCNQLTLFSSTSAKRLINYPSVKYRIIKAPETASSL